MLIRCKCSLHGILKCVKNWWGSAIKISDEKSEMRLDKLKASKDGHIIKLDPFYYVCV